MKRNKTRAILSALTAGSLLASLSPATPQDVPLAPPPPVPEPVPPSGYLPPDPPPPVMPATTAQSGVFTTLKVENGTGDGNFAPGTMVTVTADPAPAGQRFVGWTGDIVILSNMSEATTTAIIPWMDVSIAAKYE